MAGFPHNLRLADLALLGRQLEIFGADPDDDGCGAVYSGPAMDSRGWGLCSESRYQTHFNTQIGEAWRPEQVARGCDAVFLKSRLMEGIVSSTWKTDLTRWCAAVRNCAAFGTRTPGMGAGASVGRALDGLPKEVVIWPWMLPAPPAPSGSSPNEPGIGVEAPLARTRKHETGSKRLWMSFSNSLITSVMMESEITLELLDDGLQPATSN